MDEPRNEFERRVAAGPGGTPDPTVPPPRGLVLFACLAPLLWGVVIFGVVAWGDFSWPVALVALWPTLVAVQVFRWYSADRRQRRV